MIEAQGILPQGVQWDASCNPEYSGQLLQQTARIAEMIYEADRNFRIKGIDTLTATRKDEGLTLQFSKHTIFEMVRARNARFRDLSEMGNGEEAMELFIKYATASEYDGMKRSRGEK